MKVCENLPKKKNQPQKKREEKGSHLGTFPFWEQSSLHSSVEKQQQKKLLLACFRQEVLGQWCVVWSGDSWLASRQNFPPGNRRIGVTVNFVLQAEKMCGS